MDYLRAQNNDQSYLLHMILWLFEKHSVRVHSYWMLLEIILYISLQESL